MRRPAEPWAGELCGRAASCLRMMCGVHVAWELLEVGEPMGGAELVNASLCEFVLPRLVCAPKDSGVADYSVEDSLGETFR